MWILNKLPQVWHPFFRLDRFARVTDDGVLPRHRGARTSASTPTKTTRSCSRTPARSRSRTVYLDPDPTQQADAEVDHGVHRREHGVRADPVRDRREGAQLALERAAHPHLPGHGLPAEVQVATPRWTCSPTAARTAARSPARSRAAGSRRTTRSTAASTNGQWTTGFPKTNADGQPFEVDAKLLEARPEPLQHLLHAVPRLRRSRPGHGPERVKPIGGAWQARNLVEAPSRRQGRRRRADAERPALQHDLERLQHDDGLRRADPRR